MNVEQIISTVLQNVPAPSGADTVDTLKAGSPSQTVRGIVVTFMATYPVLRKAVELGANLIITHEPTFYNHADRTDWLGSDEVFRSKRRLIEENGLAVWRFHDGPHRFRIDAIVAGISARLGWSVDPAPDRQHVFTVAPQSVRSLAEGCKQRLGISRVRVAGDLEAVCTRVGLLVGSAGGARQITMLRDEPIDALVCGESAEWETCEYVRDAAAAGYKKALIVLGHANSEEAGVEWLAAWLRPIVPAVIPIHFVQAGDPFRFV